jgi:hypothetical protein
MITFAGANDALIVPRGVIKYYRVMAARYAEGSDNGAKSVLLRCIRPRMAHRVVLLRTATWSFSRHREIESGSQQDFFSASNASSRAERISGSGPTLGLPLLRGAFEDCEPDFFLRDQAPSKSTLLVSGVRKMAMIAAIA